MIRFKTLTSKDGLSGDVVYSIFEDRDGYLWIGTHRGLDRYDGYGFKHYIYDPEDSNSLSSNHVHKITQDRFGRLWLCTLNGIDQLDQASGRIRHFYPTNPGIDADFRNICILDDKTALVLSASAWSLFNPTTGEFILLKKTDSGNPSVNFYRPPGGDLYLTAMDTVLWRFDPGERKLVPVSRKQLGLPGEGPVGPMMIDSQSKPWIVTYKPGFFQLEGWPEDSRTSRTFSSTAVQYFVGLRDFADGGTWFFDRDGLFRYDYAIRRFENWRHQPADAESLSNNGVTELIRDRHQTYWVGTFGSGLCYFRLETARFRSIQLPPGEESQKARMGAMVTLQSGKIFTGINDKLILLVDSNRHAEPISWSGFNLASLLKERFGLDYTTLSPKEKGFLESVKGRINDGYASRLYCDRNGRLWFVDSHIRNSDTAIAHNAYLEGPFVVDSLNRFLFATRNGVYQFDPGSLKAEEVKPARSSPFSTEGRHCKWIYPDPDGNCWIAMAEDGLVFWDRHTNRMNRYTTRDGLPDNSLYVILPDQHGRLWISTNKGLSCFDPSTQRFANFTTADGLLNTEFNSASGCIDKAGRMFFGGMDGIDYFFPDSILANRVPPVVQLSGFRVFGIERPLKSRYSLQSEENTIAFSFTCNDFLLSKQIFFRYRLKQADPGWVVQQGENEVNYNKLPPGNYDFEVQASFDSRQWGPAARLNLKIATPFFSSTWFYALVGLLVAGCLYLFFRFRLRQQLKLFAIRQKLHRDLHDDVGATLSSVKAYSEILRRNPDNPVIADLISENAAEMIDTLEVIAWATSPQLDHLRELKSRMQKAGAPLCHSHQIHFRLESRGLAEDSLVPGEIRQNLFLIFKEAINNLVKYSGASECETLLYTDRNRFVLQITDNGQGADGNVRGGGNGWQNMRRRADELRGQLEISAVPGGGTRIRISLPYPFRTGPGKYKQNDHSRT